MAEDVDFLSVEQALEVIDSEVSSLFFNLNPINTAEEKRRFFSEDNYNPSFGYTVKRLSQKAQQMLDKLEAGSVHNDALRELIKNKIVSLKRSSEMLDSVGDPKFCKLSNKYYGLPSKELIYIATQILEKTSKKDEETVSSDIVFDAASYCLKSVGLTDWKVEYKDMVAHAMVQAGEKKIYVKKKSQVPVNFIQRMIFHEIGTHVFRAVNGSRQPHIIFSLGTKGYLETEEGLAANVEEMQGCLDENTLRTYAGRVLAVDFAQKNSFRKTYESLLKHFLPEEAWQITLRVKRGNSETSKKGCYSKDHLYLKGYCSVKKYLSENKDGLGLLFMGKISIEDIKVIKKIPGMVPPSFLPDQYKLSHRTTRK